MQSVRKITNDLYWIGANDKRLGKFENIHELPDGVSYNSYLLKGTENVLFDTCDWSVGKQFIENLEYVLDGDYLNAIVVNHVEPDHAATLGLVLKRWPDAEVYCTAKARMILRQFGYDLENVHTVEESDSAVFGKHEVSFIKAPMVHWPEVMVTYDKTEGILFSADAFGSFGTLDGRIFADEMNYEKEMLDEARRYYTNIVGKYGPQVQALLKKAGNLDEINYVCPLHGPIWRKKIGYIIDKYDKWSKYEPEEQGVLIVYASMYGNTESAAWALASKLADKGVTNIKVEDVSNKDNSYLVSETFERSHLVLMSVTYNLKIFPPMRDFIEHLEVLNVQKRNVAIVENGSWAPQAGKLIRAEIEKMKNMNILDDDIHILSSGDKDIDRSLDDLADKIVESM